VNNCISYCDNITKINIWVKLLVSNFLINLCPSLAVHAVTRCLLIRSRRGSGVRVARTCCIFRGRDYFAAAAAAAACWAVLRWFWRNANSGAEWRHSVLVDSVYSAHPAWPKHATTLQQAPEWFVLAPYISALHSALTPRPRPAPANPSASPPGF